MPNMERSRQPRRWGVWCGLRGMRLRGVVKIGAAVATMLSGVVWLHGQDASSGAAPVRSAGLPPRLTPADYQFHVQAGSLTIAAEFMGHNVPTEEGGPYATEAYVVVMAALFGAPNTKIQLNNKDFSLRINGKKPPVPSQPYVLVFPTLTDPEWGPTHAEKEQAMTAAAGGKAGQPQFKAAPIRMPIEQRHVMEQRVVKAALPEGDRALPQAGLLYFEWRADTKGIRSMELLYSGPAGNATLPLEKP
jgi:hypothetical protein